MPDEAKSSKAKGSGGNVGGSLALECVDLLDKVLKSLASRAATEEPFSADLTGGVEPLLRALGTIGETYITTVRDQIAASGPAARSALDEKLRSAGATDLLNAAIAVSATPSAADALETSRITLDNGAVRIPWLEIVKEIINLILSLLPNLPGWLTKLINEILKLIDKIFGGMPHEDHATRSIAMTSPG
jgi:hypothetical protein